MYNKLDNNTDLYAILEYTKTYKTTSTHSGDVYEGIKIHIVKGVASFFMLRNRGEVNNSLYSIISSSETVNNLTGKYPNSVGVLNIRESKKFLDKNVL